MPGSQAVRWCLIVYPDRVNANGHAKGRPRRWHSRSVEAPRDPVFGRAADGSTKAIKVAVLSNVLACAVGRSSVRVVPRTAGILFSKNSSHIILAVIKV